MPARVTQAGVEVLRAANDNAKARVTQAGVEVLRVSVSGAARTAGNTVQFSHSARKASAFGKTAFNAILFAQSNTHLRPFIRAAQSAVQFAQSAVETARFARRGANAVQFALAQIGRRLLPRAARSSVRFLQGAGLRLVDLAGADGYAGRVQVGEEALLVPYTADHVGSPALPTATATVTIYELAGGTKVATYDLARPRPTRLLGLLARRVELRAGFAPGRYMAVYRSPVGGFVAVSTDHFEITAGGDAQGVVLSACSLDRPAPPSLVAQLASGRLLEGRRPRLP